MTPQGPALYRGSNKNIWQFNVSLLPCMEQEESRYWLVDFLISVSLKLNGCYPEQNSTRMWLTAEGQRLVMGKERGKTVFTPEGEWMWCGSEWSDNWLVKRTLNRRGRKPAWGGEQTTLVSLKRECLCDAAASDQSQPLLDTWKPYPMLLCRPWIMKQINLWLWGSEIPLLLIER